MKALITGVCGQDGWYLSELLLDKGYEVVGTRRGNEEPAQQPPGVKVVFGDVSDASCIRGIIEDEKPDEIYNLAAITHVGDSFSAMAASFAVNAVGAANCLDGAARVGAKFYQASTSELYGDTPAPQNEQSLMAPRSPYACAKLAAYWLTKNYRERGVHATNGILFNHESPRRGGGFVTQKVCRGVVAISKGEIDHITLGNLNAKRDWGHARDFVRGMWMMMQAPPGDYVLATGKTHTVADLCEEAFKRKGLDWTKYVRTDPKFYRPLEVENLCGDASKMNALGWEATTSFQTMIGEMVHAAS